MPRESAGVITAAKRSFVTQAERELHELELGFHPSAAIAWWTCQAGYGSQRGNRGGIGFWSDQAAVAVAWSSRDGETVGDTAWLAERCALLGSNEGGAAVAMKARTASFTEHGVNLHWVEPPSEPWVVHVLALGNLEAARVGFGSAPPEADLVLLVPAPDTIGAWAERVTIGIGAATSRRRASAGYIVTAGTAPGDVTGAQQTGAASVALDPAPAQVAYLALDGVRASVGFDVSPAKDGVRRTHVGFEPAALLLFSWGLESSASPKRIGRLCLGGAAGAHSGCASWDDRNVDAPETRTHVASSDEHTLLVIDTRTGGLHAEARLASLDGAGFTLDWEKDSDAAREFVHVAIGSRD